MIAQVFEEDKSFCYDRDMTNLEIAELLRNVAAAYEILGENPFKTIAYQKAADSIEHLTSDLKDMWDDGKLDTVPGVGSALASHLDELFRTGKVKHFDQVLSKLPKSIYPLLLVPGLGPKKAYKLVSELTLKDSKTVIADLEKAAQTHKIAAIVGFGEKSEEVILSGIESYKRGQIKENRMMLPEADGIARDIINYLKKMPEVNHADPLGSLRRQVATIGDIDIAVATRKPAVVIEHFVKYPHQKLIDKGAAGATLLLNNGRQVDLRVQKPEAYGAMLQYFTGSKHHNIKLRTYAVGRGLSLNEYGIKQVKTGKLTEFASEEGFYQALHMPYIPPEIREDKGEIEAAVSGRLPKLIELSDIKGDLHMHTNYNFSSSHDIGASHVKEHLDKAAALGYEYIGISDHNPSISNQTQKQIVAVMKKRKEWYEQQYYSLKDGLKKRVHLLIMCEVDILTDGKLALPDEAFEYVDAAIVSLHSSFTQSRKDITKRIITALTSHPKVRIFGHPTGRLLARREGVDADWPEVFATCKKHSIALEINAYPDRLDLPDSLVYEARKEGVKFCIDTDSHEVDQMDMMRYGVSVARRGWATKHDIVNTLGYNEFKSWLQKGV